VTPFYPSREEFLRRASQGNLIPVHREIVADMETPVSAFRKLCDTPYAFLLESVEGGETLGRYSFLGSEPRIVFRSKRRDVEILHANGRKESFGCDSPMDALRSVLDRYQFVPDPTLPPFCGGAVGYVSYDEIRNIEPVGSRAIDDRQLPDIFFIITDTLVIFDHVRHRLRILANALIEDGANPMDAYDAAIRRINAVHQRLLRPVPRCDQTVNSSSVPMESNFTPEDFEEIVEKAKEYIRAGDIFQVVLSQRFEVPITCDPFDIYRALRAVNPSPYMFYLQFDDLRLAGSSPEILVRVSGDQVQIRPIAGTRPRGATREEDLRLERELLADPKERAEHIMLVDLGRNDCGRVCEFGTVRVDDLMVIERYSHVMHIVSNVTGKLRPGLNSFDVLKAAFPAGTVSGAPKIRAMQIIDELEPVMRGPYAGAVGYLSYDGNLDSCITIRTIVIHGDRAYIQAGAGIVADSDPANEYRETINKASALVRAIELAETGLD
jgi:anthranilate synthase component 1